MAHRHVVAVDHIGVAMSRIWRKMRDDLVSVKIKVDPLRRGTAFRATQQSTIKGTRLVQTGDGKRQVKRHGRHEAAPDKNVRQQFTAPKGTSSGTTAAVIAAVNNS